MKTLHSIDLKYSDEPCFAKSRYGNCTLLTVMTKKCNYKCAFYKPYGCKDWIRINDEHGSNLIPPEEYEKEKRRQQ